MSNKKSILQRLANTLAERMTWERDDENWSQFTKDVIQCVLSPSGIHLSKWVKEGDSVRVLLDDLVNDTCAWSESEEEDK